MNTVWEGAMRSAAGTRALRRVGGRLCIAPPSAALSTPAHLISFSRKLVAVPHVTILRGNSGHRLSMLCSVSSHVTRRRRQARQAPRMIAEVVSEVLSSVQFNNIPRRLSTSRNSKAAFRETHSVLNLGSSVSEERCAWRVGKRRLYTVEHLVVLPSGAGPSMQQDLHDLWALSCCALAMCDCLKTYHVELSSAEDIGLINNWSCLSCALKVLA